MSRYYNAMDTGSEELEHYGVQGMKWGVRKYVNPDGTLTTAGKQRYGTYQNAFKKNRAVRNDQSKREYKQDIANAKNKYRSTKGTRSWVGRRVTYGSDVQTARLNRSITRIGGDRVSTHQLNTSKKYREVRNVVRNSRNYGMAAHIARSVQRGDSRGKAVLKEVGRQAANEAIYQASKETLKHVAAVAIPAALAAYGKYRFDKDNNIVADAEWREVPQALISMRH